MKRRHTLAVHADANLNDAITTTTHIDTALDNLDTAKRGHPTSTPGANPTTARGTSTPTGNEPDITPDRAVADEKALRRHIHAANKHLRSAAILSVRWGAPESSNTLERLTTIDAKMWCENHLKHFMKEVRRPGHNDCDYCTQFRTQYKRTAPIEILDHRARYGRLTETQTRRLIVKADTRIAAERRARKQAAKAEQTENSVT